LAHERLTKTDNEVRAGYRSHRIGEAYIQGKISVASTFEELSIDSLDGLNILFDGENIFDIDIPGEAALNPQCRTDDRGY